MKAANNYGFLATHVIAIEIRAEAAEAIETEEQALSWLNLDNNTSDDFVQVMFSLKVWLSKGCFASPACFIRV